MRKITGAAYQMIFLLIAMSYGNSVRALEIYAAADAVGTPLPGGTLLLTSPETTTDFWVFAKISQSEANLINSDLGINAASYRNIIPDTALIGSITSETEAGLLAGPGWTGSANTTIVPPGSQYYTYAGSGNNTTVAVPTPPAFTLLPLAKLTFTLVNPPPGQISKIATIGTDPLNDWFTGGLKDFATIGISFTSTQYTIQYVPEPTTYALAAVSCIVLGIVAKRKSSTRGSLLARRGVPSRTPR